MLSEEEKHEVLAERKNSPTARMAVGEALKIVQRRRGWVSDESIVDLAELLGMTPAELDSVATFYSLIYRKPVGRHVILLCDSVNCWILGEENLRAHMVRKLGVDFGQTTSDGRFTLLPVACLGACDRAPAMMIDETLYGPLNEAQLDGILEQYR